MYTPSAFAMAETADIHAAIRAARLATFITATAEGPMVTPLPLYLDESEGEHGVLYGHLARANPHWRPTPIGDGLALFMGPEAYITPSWYQTKRDTGKVVPTWNYVAVEASGPVEFFEDASRLLDVVTSLTRRHEAPRQTPWEVSDAPADYIASQLRGIVGLRLPITRLAGKRKMSQNRSEADRACVAEGLAASAVEADKAAARVVAAQRQ